MTEKKAFITVFDIIILLVIAALAVVIALCAAPTGRTVDIKFTVVVSDDTSALSVGDVLVCISGGCLGTVAEVGDGYIEVTAEAELHAGVYYSGSVAVCDGREYEICVGADKYSGAVRRIVEV